MLRKLFCFAALAVFAVPVQAGVISSLLDFDGNLDILSDDSASVVRDVGTTGVGGAGNGILDVGDVIQAVFEIRTIDGQQTASVGGDGATVLGIVALEVQSFGASVSGIDTVYNLGLVSAANAAFDLSTLLSTTNLGGLLGVASSSIALITRTDDNFQISPTGSNSLPLDGTDPSLFDLDPTPWTAEVLLGAAIADDFYQISLDGLMGAPGPTVPLSVPGIDLGDQIGEYRLAQTVIDSDFGTTGFGALTVQDFSGANKTSDFVHAGNNSLFAPKLFGQTPVGFDISDDGDFALNPLPEPSSLAVFACLGVAIVGRLRRRKHA
jgi:hypothetical protein